MQIKNIEFRKLRIDLPTVFKVAFTEISFTENVLVKITTDDGFIGFGEAAPTVFITGETADSVISVLNILRDGLIGVNPLAIDQVHAIMNSAVKRNSSAKCAIDLALYDIKGKVMGKPVYQVLGGGSGTLQNDITIGIAEPEEMAIKAKHYVHEKGYRILKVKAGINPQDDIRALQLIRDSVGQLVRIRVDANQGYSVCDAINVLEAFREIGVEAVEQCLPDWDIEGAAYLRAGTKGIRLIVDESIHSPKDAVNICRLGAADILNIKLMKCGGLYPAEQINAIADANGLKCMVGCMLETRLAITAGLSLVAAKHNVTDADCDSFMFYDNKQTGVNGGFTYDGDLFKLSDKPGFGVEVDF